MKHFGDCAPQNVLGVISAKTDLDVKISTTPDHRAKYRLNLFSGSEDYPYGRINK